MREFIILFCFVLAAWGQEAGVGIAAIPNAKGSAIDLARGTKTATTANQTGYYQLPLLTPGDYVGQQIRFDLNLNLGDVSQQVTAMATNSATIDFRTEFFNVLNHDNIQLA
jgi:hypothetical protein